MASMQLLKRWAKTTFNVQLKHDYNCAILTSQHGPNEHPVVDEHGHHKYLDKHSQSKINHYSKNQDTIILSSGESCESLRIVQCVTEICWSFLDVPVNEEHVAEINDKKRYNPSILELKPNVHIGAPSHGHSHSFGSQSSSSHHSAPSSSSSGHHGYQPLKFRPTAEINDFKPSYQTHHSDVVVGSQYKPSEPTYKPGTVLKLKPKQVVKKVKLVTPGLKHYATSPKIFARNDYETYFRNRAAYEEQREASQRLVQGMYRRSPRTLLAPQYAPSSLNYNF